MHVRMGHEFGVPPDECKTAIARIDPSGARTILIPLLLSAAVIGGCVVMVRLILFGLEHLAPRAYEWTQREDVSVLIVFVWFFALVLAERVYLGVRTRIIRHRLRKRLTAYWCIHCGYDFTGLPKSPPSRVCPECGKQSPVATTANPT